MESTLSEIKGFISNLRKYHIDYPFLITTGSALTLGLIVGWKLRRDLQRAKKSSDDPDLSCLVDRIDLTNVARLAACPKIKVKRCAEQILLDRAMRTENLRVILKAVDSSDLRTIKKAVSVLGMLVRCPEFKERIISCGTLQSLVQCISSLCDGNNYDILVKRCREVPDVRKVLEDAIFSLSELITGDMKHIGEQFYSYDRTFITNIILPIMCDTQKSVSYPTRTCAVLLLNQLGQCLSPRLHEMMIEDDVPAKTADCFLKTLGDKLIAQCLLQLIVTIVSQNDKHDIDILRDIGKYKIISPLIGCIKSDNPELVYWALELLHEFAQKDMFKLEICKQPGIIKTLTLLLKENEACVQAIVLRIFSYLALLNEMFQKKLLDFSPLIQHLSICLASGVPNVYHWALVLVHDIARGGREATEKLLETNLDLVKCVLPHALSNSYITMRTALETLGFFYPCDSFHDKIFTPGSMKVFTDVSAVDDKDIREWAAAFLVRMSMSSDEARSTIVTDGCIHPLMQLAAKTDDANMAWEVTRTLVMVGFLDSKLSIQLKSGLESSVIVDGKEYSPGKDGLNVVTFDVSSFKFQGLSFPLNTPQSIKEFKEFVMDLPEWFLILLSFQRGDNELMTGTHEIEDQLEVLLPANISFEPQSAFCLFTLKSEYFKEVRSFKCHAEDTEMELELDNIGNLVSITVLYNLVLPLMDVLMGIPATSNMSKVAELESLTILAQQATLAGAMVATAGFLEHLNELIWNFTSLNQAAMVENPLKLVHCIGSMKIVHLISGLQEYQTELITRNTIDAIVSLLITLSQVSITGVEEASREGLRESPLPTHVLATNKRCASLSHYYTVDEKGAYGRKEQGASSYRSTSTDFREQSREVELRQYDILQLEEEEEATEVIPRQGLPVLAFVVDSEEASDVREIAIENVTDKNDELAGEDISVEGSDFEEELIPFAFEDDEFDDDGRPHTQGEMRGQDLNQSWRPHTSGSELYSRPFQSVQSRGRTLSRALSRSLTESSFRVKSPMKNLTSDLESFSEATENLTDYVISTLYHLLHGKSREEVKTFLLKSRGYFLLLGVTLCSNQSLNQKIKTAMSSVLITLFGDPGEEDTSSAQRVVKIEKKNATPSIAIGSDQLTVRNGSWTFESVFANHYVSKSSNYRESIQPSGWYFEVILLTKGIMQIGWTTKTSNFSVEKGIGVGDMEGSVAFDGFRCKILNGSPKECDVLDYGKEWDQGDVIGCSLSWNGDVSFTMNGEGLGTAVSNLDVNRKWFPAASLTCSNQCKFAFARNCQRYSPPPGFVSVEEDLSLRVLVGQSQDAGNVASPTEAKAGNIATSRLSIDVRGQEAKEMITEKKEIFKRPISSPLDIAPQRRSNEKGSSSKRDPFPVGNELEHDISLDNVVAYFEIRCTRALSDSFEFGYTSCDGTGTRRTFKVTISKGEIMSCSGDRQSDPQNLDFFDTVGCAVLWPSCRILLTADGIPSDTILNPPSDEKTTKSDNLMPYISPKTLIANFGEDDFKFRYCNLPDVRVKMAKYHIATVLAEEQDVL